MNSSVATIGQTSAAVPEHLFTQEDIKRAVRALLPLEADRVKAVLALFDSAGVSRRYSVVPMDSFGQRRDLTETMAMYKEQALRLGRQVARDCLERAKVAPGDVDLVITVSCTGFMIPSLDAYLANDLGFRSDVRRLPITELGCLGGAAALAHARDYILAYPQANVLVVSVELPTLSFQRDDLSSANLVSTALFGDGAAAVLVTGRAVPGAQLLDSLSHLFPGSANVLGFDLKEDGFHVVLARELPGLVRTQVRHLVARLLERAGVSREALGSFALHAGGPRVLGAVEDELGLRPEETGPSREVLRDYGNLSSASVLFVLHDWFTRRRPAPGSHGLVGAFGPGFSAELLVVRWT